MLIYGQFWLIIFPVIDIVFLGLLSFSGYIWAVLRLGLITPYCWDKTFLSILPNASWIISFSISVWGTGSDNFMWVVDNVLFNLMGRVFPQTQAVFLHVDQYLPHIWGAPLCCLLLSSNLSHKLEPPNLSLPNLSFLSLFSFFCALETISKQ
jgi:hypothetical protein